MHVYNNLFENWGNPLDVKAYDFELDGKMIHIPAYHVSSGYVARSADEAFVLLENNIILSGHGANITTFGKTPAVYENGKIVRFAQDPGNIRLSGNLILAQGVTAKENHPERVADPIYNRPLFSNSDKNLLSRIRTDAGPIVP